MLRASVLRNIETPGATCTQPRQSWIRLAVVLSLLSGTAVVRAATLPHGGTVVSIEDLTADTKRIRFRAVEPAKFHFRAGQFVLLKVPGDYVREWNARYHTTHKEVVRPYSFASSPGQLPYFDLIVKQVAAPPGKDVPPGLASTFIHERLKAGDVLLFSDPMGGLSVQPEAGRPIILVAGGTGAAPFLSLLESWFENGAGRDAPISFFFGVGKRRDLFLDEQFRRWAATRKDFTYIPALVRLEVGEDWSGETGYISDALDRNLSAPSAAEAYVAGPPAMVRQVEKVLIGKGISKERIHYDPITVQ